MMTSVGVIRVRPQNMWCCGRFVVKHTLVPVRATAHTGDLTRYWFIRFFHRFPMQPYDYYYKTYC